VDEKKGLKVSLNEMASDKKGVEKKLKEVEMDRESANIKVGKLELDLVEAREIVSIADAHAEVEFSSDSDSWLSTGSIGITTADKEEVSESDAANDVSNSNVNAGNTTTTE